MEVKLESQSENTGNCCIKRSGGRINTFFYEM